MKCRAVHLSLREVGSLMCSGESVYRAVHPSRERERATIADSGCFGG